MVGAGQWHREQEEGIIPHLGGSTRQDVLKLGRTDLVRQVLEETPQGWTNDTVLIDATHGSSVSP